MSNLQVGSQPVVLRPVVMEMKTTWKEERKDARCPQRMSLSLVNAKNTGNLQPASSSSFFFLFISWTLQRTDSRLRDSGLRDGQAFLPQDAAKEERT